MSQRDPQHGMRDMIEYAQAAQRIAAGKTRDDLEHDETIRFALIHAVEIIGEAANRVPESVQQALDEPDG